jgi:hypothetical protein
VVRVGRSRDGRREPGLDPGRCGCLHGGRCCRVGNTAQSPHAESASLAGRGVSRIGNTWIKRQPGAGGEGRDPADGVTSTAFPLFLSRIPDPLRPKSPSPPSSPVRASCHRSRSSARAVHLMNSRTRFFSWRPRSGSHPRCTAGHRLPSTSSGYSKERPFAGISPCPYRRPLLCGSSRGGYLEDLSGSDHGRSETVDLQEIRWCRAVSSCDLPDRIPLPNDVTRVGGRRL